MDLAGNSVLVTGGAGFIGSTLCEQLLRLGSNVVAYDNLDDFYSGKERNLLQLNGQSRFKFVRGDILDSNGLDSVMKGVEVVFHLAAQPGVRYCIEHIEKANDVNVTGTVRVLNSAKKSGVKRFVYASSSSVYGDPVSVPMSEEHPQNPTNPYGASKLAGEKYCTSFGTTYNMDVVCLRYFSVYGPRGRPDLVIPSFAQRVSRGEEPIVYGDGRQSRDFTYISDIVEGTVLSAMTDGTRGEVLNLGFGKDVSISRVAEEVASYYRVSLRPKHLEAYPGDFKRTKCSNSKARRLLGWRPKVGVEEGIKKYLDWFSTSVPAAGTVEAVGPRESEGQRR